MSNERVLCIGAHPDDESFGCLGTLLKHKAAGDKLHFLWFTAGRNHLEGSVQCASYFGSDRDTHMSYPDQTLETEPFTELISVVETEIQMTAPTIIYCPFVQDLNRDHRIVAEATFVAARPYKTQAKVLQYFIPGTSDIGLRRFQVDLVVPIDAKLKTDLIDKWYPGERINGREEVKEVEVFERWPR